MLIWLKSFRQIIPLSVRNETHKCHSEGAKRLKNLRRYAIREILHYVQNDKE